MYFQYNGEKDCLQIPLAKNCKIQQVAYQQVEEKVGPYNQRGGGKFGADYLLYDGDPDKCHAKFLGYKKMKELIGSNRLAEKTDKQVMLINKFIVKRLFRRKILQTNIKKQSDQQQQSVKVINDEKQQINQ